MDKRKKLEFNRLIKELEFIESDLEYKSEILQEADKKFIESVNKLIDGYPDIKKALEKKLEIQINIDKEIEEEIEEDIEIKDKNLKNIYRSIVKLTHPDMVNDENLNNMYIESTKHYDNDDIVSIFKICDRLNIEYEISDNDRDLVNDRIKSLKERVIFLENTFPFKWYISEDSEKDEILFKFIKLKVS